MRNKDNKVIVFHWSLKNSTPNMIVRIGVIKLINEEIKGLVYCKPKKPVQIAEKIIIAINTTGLTIFWIWG